MESAAHSARAGDSSPNGEPLLGAGSKCTSISIPGSSEGSDSKCTTISIPGSQSVVEREPAVSIAGHLGRKSRCEPFETAIGSKMEAGLSAQRIYQDLVEEKGFLGFLSVGLSLRAPA